MTLRRHPGYHMLFSDLSNLDDYDNLWRFLQSHPALQDKAFPERSSREAWAATFTGFETRSPGVFSKGVVLSGSLRFNESDSVTDPFFHLKIQPLRLDLTHRLGRRLGNDRFIEIDVPILSKCRTPLPKLLAKLGEAGQATVIEWLVDANHRLLGRGWKPFFTRPKEGKGQRKESSHFLPDNDVNRVTFFAVDGHGFTVVKDPFCQPRKNFHHVIPINVLLNFLRPTRKNEGQSYLKLFSRTALGMQFSFSNAAKDRLSNTIQHSPGTTQLSLWSEARSAIAMICSAPPATKPTK